MSDTTTEMNAKIARTAPSRDHLNRIILNKCGVTELRLTAGGRRSVSHLPDGSADKDAQQAGADAFNFAPGTDKNGKTIDPVEIIYSLLDPRGAITKATLELLRPKSKTPLWTLDLNPKELDGALLKSGTRHIQWNGCLANKIVKTAGADGKDTFTLKWESHDAAKECPYVSLAFANYRLRLRIEAAGQADPAQAFTYFHILAHSIELELGPKSAAPFDRDKQLWDTLDAAKIAAGRDVEVRLKSNVFKTSSAEMATNAGHEEYRKAWGQIPKGTAAYAEGHGPNIPLFAKVWIQDSKGAKVEAPHALRDAKFLWDWETPADQDLSGLLPRKQVFVGEALNYLETQTKPKRDNCHIDRGGKRGEDANPVFPASVGYAPQSSLKTDGSFPFPVAPHDAARTAKKRNNLLVRRWAALSEGWASWRNPDLASKTGVLFQPSRMAGDRYKVTVYLCCETKDFDDKDDTVSLDIDADAPLIVNDRIKKSSGVFTIWRELHLVKYLKKTSAASITSIKLNDVARDYEPAYIHLADKTGGIQYMDAATYKSEMNKAAAAYPDWEFHLMVDPATDQHASGPRFIYFRSHAQWKAAVDKKVKDEDWTRLWFHGWKWTPLGAMYDDTNKYYENLGSFAMTLYPQVVRTFISAAEGINIFQFQHTHNQPGGTGLLGFAVEMPKPTPDKCGFILCDDDASYNGTVDNRENTMAHEVGHHLFLPHNFQVEVSQGLKPGAHDPLRVHDKNDEPCMMSYVQNRKVAFCGFCLLRLRGWSIYKTDAAGDASGTRTLVETSASNKK